MLVERDCSRDVQSSSGEFGVARIDQAMPAFVRQSVYARAKRLLQQRQIALLLRAILQ